MSSEHVQAVDQTCVAAAFQWHTATLLVMRTPSQQLPASFHCRGPEHQGIHCRADTRGTCVRPCPAQSRCLPIRVLLLLLLLLYDFWQPGKCPKWEQTPSFVQQRWVRTLELLSPAEARALEPAVSASGRPCCPRQQASLQPQLHGSAAGGCGGCGRVLGHPQHSTGGQAPATSSCPGQRLSPCPTSAVEQTCSSSSSTRRPLKRTRCRWRCRTVPVVRSASCAPAGWSMQPGCRRRRWSAHRGHAAGPDPPAAPVRTTSPSPARLQAADLPGPVGAAGACTSPWTWQDRPSWAGRRPSGCKGWMIRSGPSRAASFYPAIRDLLPVACQTGPCSPVTVASAQVQRPWAASR